MTKILAKKHLGQNFLVDPRVKKRIVFACDLSRQDIILEIGPGTGALTELIAPQVKTIYAVEKDRGLYDELQKKFHQHPNVQIIHKDFLAYDLTQLPLGAKVIGNLPYNISTPILEKFITEKHLCQELFFTVQLEFGKRMASQPNSRDYGSLSCFVQYYYDVQILFHIPNSCFRPIPKVTSCFLKMTLRKPRPTTADTDLLFRLIRRAFQQRRKKISNSLSLVAGIRLSEILEKLGIDENKRAENLSLEDYIAITEGLSSRGV